MKLSTQLVTIGAVVSLKAGAAKASFLRGLSDLDAPVQTTVKADSFAITVGATFSGNECPAEAPNDKDFCSKYLQQCRYPIIGCANGNTYDSSPSYWICNCDSVNQQYFCSVNCEGTNCNEPCAPTDPDNSGPKPIQNEAWCPATYVGNNTQCDYVGVTCDYDSSMGVPNKDLLHADDRLNCQCQMKGKDKFWICENTIELVDVAPNSLAANEQSSSSSSLPASDASPADTTTTTTTTTVTEPFDIRSGPLGDAACPYEPPLSYDACSNDESEQRWLQCQYLIEGQQHQRWTCNCGTNDQFTCSLNGIQ